jgi:transcriptional regulator with PAS, ATPase and Fis domain
MVESQLFGYRRGSFTGATEHFQGIIRGANRGTLLLDEIGDMGLDVQPKLLRFLESGEVHPIGEPRPIDVDVRVIAATNVDLEQRVTAKEFREDLYYRLNVVPLRIPALRDRRGEIPGLVSHYLAKYSTEFDKGDLRVADETMEYLVLFRWPGNIRQLANQIKRMAAMAEPGAVLMPQHLPSEISSSRRTVAPSQLRLEPDEIVVRLDQPLASLTEALERAAITRALDKHGKRVDAAAKSLGLSRKGLYLKRQRYKIQEPG